MEWPQTPAELIRTQVALAAREPDVWDGPDDETAFGGCFVCFARDRSGPGAAGDRGWAAAVTLRRGRLVATATVEGEAGAPYMPGLLALREGRLLEAAVRALAIAPDVLLVNATGRDHPRRAGLALHLGALLDLPTIGVTDRTLLVTGEEPPHRRGATAALYRDGEVVGYRLRTVAGARSIAVHAAWRTAPDVAVEAVRLTLTMARTPEPLRQARRLARTARSRSEVHPLR